MFEYTIPMTVKPHPGAIDNELRTQLGNEFISGSSTGYYGLRVNFYDTPDMARMALADAIAAAHDPVFLSVDKQLILADGLDEATVTVRAPKPGAAAVSLLVDGVAYPVTLTDGAGTFTIASSDPLTFEVSVANPENRSADALIIQAEA
jgi:hypothetical protein